MFSTNSQHSVAILVMWLLTNKRTLKIFDFHGDRFWTGKYSRRYTLSKDNAKHKKINVLSNKNESFLLGNFHHNKIHLWLKKCRWNTRIVKFKINLLEIYTGCFTTRLSYTNNKFIIWNGSPWILMHFWIRQKILDKICYQWII